MLPADRIDAWLDPARTDNRAVGEVLHGIEPPALQIRTVSRDVNKVGNNGPQLLDPLPDEVDRPLQLALA